MANDELMRLADRIAEKRREGSGESIWLATLELYIRALAQRAPQNGAVPEGWRDKLYRLSDVVGLIMDEVKESTAYGRLDELCFDLRTLAAASAPEAAHDPCLVLWQAMNEAEKVGLRTDDKLIVQQLRRSGYFIAARPQVLSPETERAKGDALGAAVLAIVDGVMSQREEVLRAFVAKHGFQPDEAVQVTHGNRWWIERRGHPAGQPEGVEALFDAIREAVEESCPRWGEAHDNSALHKLYRREREWIASRVFAAVARRLASAQRAEGDNTK